MMAGGKDDPSLVWSNSPLRLSETRHLPPVFDGHQMDTEDPFLNNMSQQELSMLQDAFSAPTPLPTRPQPQTKTDIPSYDLSNNIREQIEQVNPSFTMMPDDYILMRATLSKPSADVANNPFILTEAECELVYGSAGFLQIHCRPLSMR